MNELKRLLKEIHEDRQFIADAVLRGIKEPDDYHRKCGQITAYTLVTEKLEKLIKQMEDE